MPHAAPWQNPDLMVCELMDIWPATIAVFIEHRMLCVGCMVGAFHTVADACREHGVDEWLFRCDIDAAIRAAAGLTL